MADLRQMFNGFGFKALSTPIDIPNTELGIETGEDLRSQLMQVKYQQNKNFVVVTQPTNYEYMQLDGHSDPIDVNNLQKDFYFGPVVGVI